MAAASSRTLPIYKVEAGVETESKAGQAFSTLGLRGVQRVVPNVFNFPDVQAAEALSG